MSIGQISICQSKKEKVYDNQRKGEAGCYLSHYNVIKGVRKTLQSFKSLSNCHCGKNENLKREAYQDLLRYRSVMILEDDTGFGMMNADRVSASLKGSGRIFYEAMSEMPDDWDMFYWMTYCRESLPNETYKPHLVKVNGGFSAIGYAVNYLMYDRLLQILAIIEDENNHLLVPVDSIYAAIHREFRCYAVIPSIAYQKIGVSTINSSYTPEVIRFSTLSLPINLEEIKCLNTCCNSSLMVYVSFIYSENIEGTNKKIIYITPGYWGDLFQENNPVFNRDDCLAPMCRLREKAAEKGFDVRMANPFQELGEFEYLIVFEVFPDQIQAVSKYPKEKLILFLWEPPSVLPQNYDPEYHKHFSKVYTWHDDLVDNKKYFKFYYPVFHEMIDQPESFASKKLATLIGCNKHSQHPNELYSHRINVIKLYESKCDPSFDLYGKWWPEDLKVYKGPITRKVDILKKYRFNYAYENIKGVPGYVTEKIFDSFQAGTVPIYWGAPNVTHYIPADCFIARENFNNEEELFHFLQNMSETEYEKYLANIRNFMKSDKKNPYTSDYFTDFMIDLFNSKTPSSNDHIPESAASVYSQIEDPLHPTDQDYLKIQNYLTTGKRNEIRELGGYYEGLARNFKMIGNTQKNYQKVAQLLFTAIWMKKKTVSSPMHLLTKITPMLCVN